MSGPKTSEYTLTPEQRANLNAQNRCDSSILACIERIKVLQNQVSVSLGSIQIYDDCGNDESVALTNSLKEKMSEIECLKKALSDRFDAMSGYQRPGVIMISDEELSRKKAILENLKAVKTETTKLLKDVENCGKQSAELKTQISSDIQENLGTVFALSWEVQQEPVDSSAKDDITSALSSLLSSTLSLELRTRVQSAIEKANNINNDDFIKNFSAVTVKPLIKECQDYIKNMETYGTEFEELEAEYIVLCSQLHIAAKKFIISESGVAELKTEIAKLQNELLEDSEQEYIADVIDEVMEKMGYDLIGSREVTKKNGKRFRDELYTFSEGTAVNIRYDNQGKIAMELGGIDSTDRLPSSSEASRLEDEMVTFCDKFTEFEKRLAAKGIVCKNRVSHLPPKAEYAQIINTSDYDMKSAVETLKAERRSAKGETKKQHRNE
jgi:hypothetical protein